MSMVTLRSATSDHLQRLLYRSIHRVRPLPDLLHRFADALRCDRLIVPLAFRAPPPRWVPHPPPVDGVDVTLTTGAPATHDEPHTGRVAGQLDPHGHPAGGHPLGQPTALGQGGQDVLADALAYLRHRLTDLLAQLAQERLAVVVLPQIADEGVK